MPDNRSVMWGATGVMVAAILLRFWAPSCPLGEKAQAETTRAKNATWGLLSNVTIEPVNGGNLLTATAVRGFHRILKLVTIRAPGRYRLSFDTKFDGTSAMDVEIGDSHQPHYGLMVANVKEGRVVSKEGDILAAGVAAVPGKQSMYRWWIDMDYVSGQAGYNISFAPNGSRIFKGNHACKLILNNPHFAALSN